MAFAMSVVSPPSTTKLRHRSPPSSSPSNPTPFLLVIKRHASGGATPTALLRSTRPQARPHPLPFSSLSSPSDPPPPLTSAVGSPPFPALLTRWSLDGRHLLFLHVAACAAAVSTSWLFFSAIPALLAATRALESMEKLLDVTAEELPETMAVVRLSGMEISDLTMELSDIGQEITQGVRSSTQTIRMVEDRLRRLTTMTPTVPVQKQANQRIETEVPMLATTARNMRDGIVKSRAMFGVMFSMTQFCWWAWNFLATHGRKQSL